MAVLKPRTKLVYFRVSEEELQQFNRVCVLEGARSVSDLARSAMQRALSGRDQGGDPTSSNLNKLEVLIESLTNCVERLGMILEEQSALKPVDERKAPQSATSTHPIKERI